VPNNECAIAAEGTNFASDIDSSVMCAMNDNPQNSACFDDGGGPLYDSTAEKLVGIVSTGSSDCQDYPTVFERIGPEFDWIQETVCKHHGEPKPSFCANRQALVTPHRYFQVVSNFQSNNGKKWCLSRLNRRNGARVLVEGCNFQNELQLWRTDSRGQIRAMNADDLCIMNVQRKQKMRMKPCTGEDQALGFTFIFDPMNKSLMWLKNKADFVQWGLRAISIREAPIEGNFSSRVVSVLKRTDGDLQKWDIVYKA